MTTFWVKSSIILFEIWPIFFFLQQFKNKIILHFVKFVARNKCMTTNFFSPLSFVGVFGSGIRDPGSEIRDPRSGSRDPGSEIRDPDP